MDDQPHHGACRVIYSARRPQLEGVVICAYCRHKAKLTREQWERLLERSASPICGKCKRPLGNLPLSSIGIKQDLP